MKGTFAPINNKPLTNDVIVARKNIFSEKVVDTIISTIENTILNAPVNYKKGDRILDMFSDLLYDNQGLKRVIGFDQYATFYLVKVFDIYTDTYFYVLYSVYDMIDYFNNNSKEHVPYVKLYETKKNIVHKICKVPKPLNYKGEDNVLSESFKYIARFDKECVAFYVSTNTISVSSIYEAVDSNNIQNNVVGKVKFIVGNFYTMETFCYDKKDIENTEYKEIYESVTAGKDMSLYAPYGIDSWVANYPTDPRKELYPKTLDSLPTENGYVVLTAILKEKPEDDGFEWEDETEENQGSDQTGEEENNPGSDSGDSGDEGSDIETPEGGENSEDTPNEDDNEQHRSSLVSRLENCHFDTAIGDFIDSSSDFTTVIYPDDGYKLSALKVFMDGYIALEEDLTDNDSYSVSIPSEILKDTDNVVIEATAVEIEQEEEPEPENKKVSVEYELHGCHVEGGENTELDTSEDVDISIFPNDENSTLLGNLIVKIDGIEFMNEPVSGNASYTLTLPSDILQMIQTVYIGVFEIDEDEV